MKKNKKITIRITESQLKVLTEKIIQENTTKSSLLRKVLEETIGEKSNVK